MEKFTKGPWSATDASRNGGKSLVCTINAKNCVVSEFDASTDARLDAALISAAPEMYEMLESLAEDYGIYNPVHKQIQELLAKARGEK